MSEFRKYDSNDRYECFGVRLAKDARVAEFGGARMVSLTFASESRREKNITLWVSANMADHQAELASFLKKGDLLHQVMGKPVMRAWGDDKEKTSFELERATMVVPLDLFPVLKERGFVPGAKAEGTKAGTKTGTKPTKAPPKSVKKVNIDDDFDDE